MQPVQVVQIEGSDMFKAIALWEDALRQQLTDPEEEWRLVNVIVQQVMKQARQGVIAMGGQTQMEMAVAVIGFFQKEEPVDVEAVANHAMNDALRKMGFSEGLEDLRKIKLKEDCLHENLDMGVCTRCGYDVIKGK